MRIGEVADLCGVSVRLLRYYEQQGLLHPSRDANGYRRYETVHIEQVREIRGMLAAGFTTGEIREFVPCLASSLAHEPCEEGLRMHLKKLQEIDHLIQTLERRRARLLHRFQRFDIAPEEITD
ncbi:MerR family transcriptional regulator [Billgrantia azerbaijanica]|nr:MerR family transcriptional regulator [Halomonas azerbaijanica]